MPKVLFYAILVAMFIKENGASFILSHKAVKEGYAI